MKRNIVAKYSALFNKPRVEQSKKEYKRKSKHRYNGPTAE